MYIWRQDTITKLTHSKIEIIKFSKRLPVTIFNTTIKKQPNLSFSQNMHYDEYIFLFDVRQAIAYGLSRTLDKPLDTSLEAIQS